MYIIDFVHVFVAAFFLRASRSFTALFARRRALIHYVFRKHFNLFLALTHALTARPLNETENVAVPLIYLIFCILSALAAPADRLQSVCELRARALAFVSPLIQSKCDIFGGPRLGNR